MLRVTLLALMFVIITLGGVTYWALRDPAPQIASFRTVQASYEKSDALLLDRHGNAIHELRTDFQGRKLDWVALADISPALVKAVVRSEDRRFYGHTGVDMRALCSAALRNLFNGEKRGASTITMQLASIIANETRPRGMRRTVAQKWHRCASPGRLNAPGQNRKSWRPILTW